MLNPFNPVSTTSIDWNFQSHIISTNIILITSFDKQASTSPLMEEHVLGTTRLVLYVKKVDSLHVRVNDSSCVDVKSEPSSISFVCLPVATPGPGVSLTITCRTELTSNLNKRLRNKARIDCSMACRLDIIYSVLVKYYLTPGNSTEISLNQPTKVQSSRHILFYF